jgi:hypothetical protein
MLPNNIDAYYIDVNITVNRGSTQRWRGAALYCGSSVGGQQAAPGNYPGFSTLAGVHDRVMKTRF